jgi:PQQ system protein
MFSTKNLAVLVAGLLVFVLEGCEYVKLFRPSVLKQVTPEVAALLNELPNVDRQNKEIVGRLFPHGGLSEARLDEDGVMRDEIRIPEGQLMWNPAVIVMPRAGELEIEFVNEDILPHAAFMPSNGDRKFLLLPVHRRGKTKLRLDGPGYYWFGCPVGNHAGRGMLGLILVRGDVPAETKLDRPKQPRP